MNKKITPPKTIKRRGDNISFSEPNLSGSNRDSFVGELVKSVLTAKLPEAVLMLKQMEPETLAVLSAHKSSGSMSLAHRMIEHHLVFDGEFNCDTEILLTEALIAIEAGGVAIYDMKNVYQDVDVGLLEFTLEALYKNRDRGVFGNQLIAHIASRVSDIDQYSSVYKNSSLLMKSILLGDLEASKTMVICGADLDFTNKIGDSARDYLEMKRDSNFPFYLEFKAFLLARGRASNLITKPPKRM